MLGNALGVYTATWNDIEARIIQNKKVEFTLASELTDSKFGNMRKGIEQNVDKRVIEIKNHTETKVTTLEEMVLAKVAEIEKSHQQLLEKMADLEKFKAEQEKRNKEQEKTIEKLTEKIAKLEKNESKLEDNLEKVEKKVGKIDGDVKDISTKLDKVERSGATTETTANKLDSIFLQFEQRMRSMEDELHKAQQAAKVGNI